MVSCGVGVTIAWRNFHSHPPQAEHGWTPQSDVAAVQAILDFPGDRGVLANSGLGGDQGGRRVQGGVY